MPILSKRLGQSRPHIHHHNLRKYHPSSAMNIRFRRFTLTTPRYLPDPRAESELPRSEKTRPDSMFRPFSRVEQWQMVGDRAVENEVFGG